MPKKRLHSDEEEDEESFLEEDSFDEDSNHSESFDDSDDDKRKRKKKPDAKISSSSKSKNKSNDKLKSNSVKVRQESSISPVKLKSPLNSKTAKISVSVGGTTSSSKAESTAEIITESEAKKVILEYFKRQNRPYSLIQVYDNLHHRASKSLVDRALSSLCNGQGLNCKEYGKAKIFFHDQSLLRSDFTSEELNNLTQECDDFRENIELLQKEEKSLKSTVLRLQSEPLDSEIDMEIQRVEDRLNVKRKKVEEIRNMHVDTNTIHLLVGKHNFYRGILISRKESVMNVVDMILDGTDKKKKADVMESLGLDIEEEFDRKLPNALRVPTSKG